MITREDFSESRPFIHTSARKLQPCYLELYLPGRVLTYSAAELFGARSHIGEKLLRLRVHDMPFRRIRRFQRGWSHCITGILGKRGTWGLSNSLVLECRVVAISCVVIPIRVLAKIHY